MALAMVLTLALCLPALASTKDDFTRAWKGFHSVAKNPKKAKYRSNWENLAKKFSRIYRADPQGSYAPKALYYSGRVYEELGTRSGMRSDLRKSCDYFGRVAARFPKHGWTDDSLYRRGLIRLGKLGETDLAYSDFLTIVHKYPRGDMASKAKAKLREMDKTRARSKAQVRPIQARQKQEAKAALTSTADPPNMAHLTAIRYTSSKDYTRVVLDLDEQVKYRYNLLPPNKDYDRPHRLYIDLEDTSLGGAIHKEIKVSDGILKSIRSGQKSKDTSRVVLDFLDLQECKVFVLPSPFRVVVDVFSPDNALVAKKSVPSKSRPKPSGSYRPPKGSKKMAGDLVEQLGLTVNTIMIDPGHGGKDPGARAFGIMEKDINLKFAKILGKKLEAKGFNVIYTRTSDKFLRLEQRTALANMKKADMFISIHCNAHKSSRVRGLETYTLNLARTKDAVRVAARENAVSPKSISDLQVILTELSLNSKMQESRDLAGQVQTKTVKSMKQHGLKNNGVREAPFYVLMGARMPSVLVELGYLTNKTEASRLKTDRYLNRLADGLVNGIMAYKRQIERFASL